MKKLLSLIIAVILLSSAALSVSAEESSKSIFTDDFQMVYYEGRSFSRFDATFVDFSYDDSYEDYSPTEVILSDKQKETVREATVIPNIKKNVIYAEIYYKDGSYLSAYYLKDDCKEIYNDLMNGEQAEYIIDFGYYTENENIVVKAEKDKLFDEKYTLNEEELENCDWFEVIVADKESELSIGKGWLIILYDEYYYVDFAENKINDPYYEGPYSFYELIAHKIIDPELMNNIKNAEETYYDDSWGVYYTDDMTKSVSMFLMVVIFAIAPLAAVIVFLILARRSKPVYKKLCYIISLLSVLELIIFTVIFALYVLS